MIPVALFQLRSVSRLFSSATRSKFPPLREKLRHLFLKVHPDLFPSSEKAQSTNAKSLSELNSLLTSIRTGSPLSKTSFGLCFFIRSQVSGSDLEKVSVQLSFPESDPKSLRVRRQFQTVLQELFHKCSMDPKFVWDDFFDQTVTESIDNPITEQETPFWAMKNKFDSDFTAKSNDKSREEVFQFLRKCQFQSQELRFKNMEHLLTLRHLLALLRSSGVRLVISNDIPLTLQRQVQIVQQFGEMIDDHPLTKLLTENAVFALSDTISAVDEYGRVSLNIRDSPKRWMKFIDEQFALQYKAEGAKFTISNPELWKTIKEMERLLSVDHSIHLMQSKSLFQSHSLSQYADYLKELRISISAKEVPYQSMSNLKFMVVAASNQTLRLDFNTGVIMIPLGTALLEISGYAGSNREESKLLQKSYLNARKSYEKVVSDAKKVSRAGSLHRDHRKIDRKMMSEFCLSVASIPSHLAVAMDHLEVIVSDEYEFIDRGASGMVRVHWKAFSE